MSSNPNAGHRDNGVDTAADRDRIDRFEAAYNRIDRELQRLLDNARNGHRRGFAASVRQICAERRHFGRHLDFLLESGELRNALVHNRFGRSEYIAVPTATTVAQLEAIDEELRRPVALRALAAKEVVTVSIDERIGRVLSLVREKGVVRFPVKRDGRIVALLTASGVVRWIASHDLEACALPPAVQVPRAPAGPLDALAPAGTSDGERIICTIASVSVGEVLARDHRKDEFAIVARGATADLALSMWSRNPRLEAIIVTEQGKPDETPLGIATATDLIKLLNERA
jgi:CBS domain-containing protein